jgi:nucleoside-diphosphate-sugar epimerase
MTLDPDPNLVVNHSVQGLRSLLNSAKKEPSVKRFVLTSSSFSAYPLTWDTELTLTKDSWNEGAVERAWAPPPYLPERGVDTYSASKVQAEKEFFRYLREENPQFVGNTVLPSSAMGPVLHPSQGGSTSNWILDCYKGISEYVPFMPPRTYCPHDILNR